jgi:hypothetical protein
VTIVRLSGPVAAASGLGRHDHVCWAYGPDDDLRQSVVTFLADGVAAGQRVAYAAAVDEAALYDVVRGLDGCDDLLRSGSLLLLPLAATYDAAEEHDPVGQVDAYARLSRAAVADGFSGFRVAAEATPLVREPGHRRSFARYEQLVDRYMAVEPFAAMCAYDTAVLTPDELTEVACVHPALHGGDLSPFQLYAQCATTSALRGEIDGFCSDLLARVLADLPGDVDAVDASALDFIDHHGLLALEMAARDRGGLTVTGARSALRRVHGLLGLQHVALAA